MSLALQMKYQLNHYTCSKCGVPIFIPNHLDNSLRRSHNTFYCLNGHNQYFPSKSHEEILKEQLAAEKRGKKFAEEQVKRERQRTKNAENRARAQKAAKTRLKNRIQNGVCPCCNRYFENLHKHMQKQHPNHAKTNE